MKQAWKWTLSLLFMPAALMAQSTDVNELPRWMNWEKASSWDIQADCIRKDVHHASRFLY